jgi:hypothetical protein
MSDKVDYSKHPGNPAAQPFNIKGNKKVRKTPIDKKDKKAK